MLGYLPIEKLVSLRIEAVSTALRVTGDFISSLDPKFCNGNLLLENTKDKNYRRIDLPIDKKVYEEDGTKF
jgi:hypothetical protein